MLHAVGRVADNCKTRKCEESKRKTAEYRGSVGPHRRRQVRWLYESRQGDGECTENHEIRNDDYLLHMPKEPGASQVERRERQDERRCQDAFPHCKIVGDANQFRRVFAESERDHRNADELRDIEEYGTATLEGTCAIGTDEILDNATARRVTNAELHE